jgi:hypothetical protein
MKASCQSVTSGLLKVAGDFLDKYQELRKEAAKIFVDTIIPGKSGSEKELDKLIDLAIDLQTDLFKAYGVVAGEGDGKIGPRHIIIPTKKVTGNLKLTERTFIVAPSIFDNVTVIIKKTDGKAGADIACCAKYITGEIYDEKRRNFDKGKESIGNSREFRFTGMVDKLLTIHLVHEGFPTDSFEYNVTVEGAFDESAIEKEGSEKRTTQKIER